MYAIEAGVRAAPPDAATDKRQVNLEQKIDGIMSMLASNAHAPIPSIPAPMTPETESTQQSHQASPNTVDKPRRSLRAGASARSTTHTPSQSQPQCLSQSQAPSQAPSSSAFHLIPGFQLTSQEAASYLSIYNREFAPNFPFVIIPPTATAQDLHDTSPGLFWAIMTAVAPQSLSTQQNVKTWFRQHIADHVVVRQDKNLQLLQAILVHLAWGVFHFYLRAEATNFLQLALALVMDLRLDKSPDSSAANMRSVLGDWIEVQQWIPGGLGKPHTLDDRRAVLGLYHLSSLISSMFKRGAQFSWSAYLAQCCSSLQQAREYPSDQNLIAMVKMQQLANAAYSFVPSPGGITRNTSTYTAAIDMAFNHTHRELDNFVNAQPATVQQNKLFSALYNVLVLRLYEPALVMASPPLETLTAEPFQRVSALSKCLSAARQSFTTLLSFTPSDLACLPLTATAVLAFTVVTSCRLLLLDSPDWQTRIARKELDLAAALKQISDNLEVSDRWATENGRRRTLYSEERCHYGSRIRWIQQWYVSKTGEDMQGTSGSDAASSLPTDGLWPDGRLNLEFWPDLMTLSDLGMQDFPNANVWPH
ncbi:hypothetical protein QQS21_005262 [Conoideocrella luteorostrata]|uniref:Transcription factor domain-containing protein n=1 Tax=Conoideocrella luteorostrata TaxID=1105319 RepID=A0AAJ0FTZ8_9HYPO|nr:hypothetical protein QQS21_005262 [Conoideocrella luteorostrata]